MHRDRLFPRPLANFLNLYFRKHGVDVRFCERVRGVERRGNKLIVHAGSGGGGLAVDAVIAGIGIDPNVALVKRAGIINVSDGIVVDKLLRTSAPDIFVAGDVANFPCTALQQRIRIEHDENAAMGRTAGLNMTGRSEPYSHLPYFYSVLFDLGYEAVGEVDRRLQIVEDWDESSARARSSI